MTGNDAFVVLDDANLEDAVSRAYVSRMMDNGQACVSAKRFIITAGVYDKFKEMLIEKIQNTTVIGDPMDRSVNLGPLVNEAQLDRLHNQIQLAISEGGATHIYGDLDIRKTRPDLEKGNYTDVIVLEGINPDSHTYQTEFFGPVFNLYKVPNPKEAVDLANKSDFGLNTSIFSQDPAKIKDISKRLRCGNVFVNEKPYTGSDFPSGGIKQSGYGRECFSDGLFETSNRKTIIY